MTEYTSLKGYIFVRKPGDLRVLLQLPVMGSRALDMVSDGRQFTLLIPRRIARDCGNERGDEAFEEWAGEPAARGVLRFAAGAGCGAG